MRFQRILSVIAFMVLAAFCLTTLHAKEKADGTNGGKTKWITVDCTKGESINAALQDTADQLYIEIQGICEEEVVVERDNVFLLGSGATDPDGIAAPSLALDIPDVQTAVELKVFDRVALLIKDSRWVYVGQGLQFVSGTGGLGAVRVVNSLAVFEDCQINNAAGWGMILEDSFVYGEDLHFQGCDGTPCPEWSGGILATDGSALELEESDLYYGQGSNIWGILVGDDGKADDISGRAQVELDEVIVQAPNPVRIVNASDFSMDEGKLIPVPADGRVALWVLDRSDAWVTNARFHGGIRVAGKAVLNLSSVSQSEEGVYEEINNDNRVNRDSMLHAQNCYLVGTLSLWDHGNAALRGEHSILEVFTTPEVPSPDAIVANVGSSVSIEGLLIGSFNVVTQSTILLWNVNQEFTFRNNRVGDSSNVSIWGNSTMWDTNLGAFSHGKIWDEGRIHGNLTCIEGSDVHCSNPETAFSLDDSGTSTCGLCPSPHGTGE